MVVWVFAQSMPTMIQVSVGSGATQVATRVWHSSILMYSGRHPHGNLPRLEVAKG